MKDRAEALCLLTPLCLADCGHGFVIRICERRLCETVDNETVATTLTLAEQNHADELKKVCLDYVSRNLATVMTTDGYRHMTASCPQLQAEILQTIATGGGAGGQGGGQGGGGGAVLGAGDRERGAGGHHRGAGGGAGGGHGGGAVRPRDHLALPEEVRRVRPRLD